MKYGLELQQNIFAPWRLSYIAYDVLKQELKTRQLDHGWTNQDESDFVHLLDNELAKVYDFVNAKLSEIDARILYCERTIQTLQKNQNMASDANYSLMDEALTEILFDVNDLSKFTRVNFTAIQKILKKHDKWTHLNLKQEYVAKLRDKPLDKQRFDVSIIYISALHDICRNRGQQNTGNSAAGGDQNAFERATAKYWIHPDNITEVKAIIMLHLPVLIFNKDKKYEPSDAAISSVYYDNANFDLYTGRLQRDEGAEAIRFRWYGPVENKSIFIERKTHHAAWLDGASVKDRFRLDEKDVNSFAEGRYTADMIASDLRQKNLDKATVDNVHFIASGVQTSFREKRLEPILRAFYNRTAFQLPGDQRLRISLDTDLTFIREDHLDGKTRRQPSYNWRRNDLGIDYPFNYVDPSDILRFPYAVLETKLQTHLGQEPPDWLTSLVESHLVHEVPRFSKYLHGACHFYKERLPLLPWWLAEIQADIKKPRAENFGLSRSRSFKPLIDGRYRRAMIEEKERVHQQAAVDGVDPPSPRRQRTNSTQDTAGAWRPISKNNSEYATISIGAKNNNGGDEPPPPPPEKSRSYYANNRSLAPAYNTIGNSNYSTNKPIDDSPGGASKWLHRMWGDKREQGAFGKPVDGDDAASDLYRRQKVKVRVEPKVFFANERTFISWLQFCALLLTVALSLLNFGDATSRAVGGVFIAIAAAVAIYALYRFEKRAWMINRRIDGRYDDLWGPAVLCTLLVVALIVNFYLRFR
ncbi:VTC domain-containing protein [Phascolomyces articulosus]|uniref:Vacuolar transporter chaperone complex subunit 4 n=1 Tax=Phascolomyces articulosus TaxID=60185 RepID=A0AAD5JVN0_9FUNG|nr:VTC domain-containing protein [Phascolomyces articulosus]